MSKVPGIATRALCQSPVLPDQVLSDIVCVEGVMFDIEFTLLTIFDVTQDF